MRVLSISLLSLVFLSLLPLLSASLSPSSFHPVPLPPSRSAPDNSIVRTESDGACQLCRGLTAVLIPMLKTNVSRSIIGTFAIAYCEYKKIDCNGNWQCVDVCQGIIAEHIDIVLDIAERTVFTQPVLCHLMNMCPPPPPGPVPPESIPVRANLSDLSGERQWPAWNLTGTGTFLHLSDIHLDVDYEPGTNTQCGEPLCCRAKNGPAPNASVAAGPWGDYNCDTPMQLFQSLIDHVNTINPVPDFILYTGDDPAHDVWAQSREANVGAVQKICGMLQQAFPHIPILPAIGNHEAFPVNQFEGPDGDQWLLEALVDAWGPWLPNDALKTLGYGGYYAARVRPGLRVLSINTNYYADGDFFLFGNHTDFSHQLAWLDDALNQTAALFERAIIIGHSNPQAWNNDFAWQFNTIIERHSKTIANLFFGHTHQSAFLVFTDNSTQTIPTAVGYVGGSITPYTDINPGYRIFTYHRDAVKVTDSLVINFESHWLDLIQSNAGNPVDWDVVRIDAVRDYPDLQGMSGDEYMALANNMFVNQTLYELYQRAYFKGVPTSIASEPQVDLACEILSMDSNVYDKCVAAHSAPGTPKRPRRNSCG